MSALALAGSSRRRLRSWMLVFFLALAVPTAVLVIHAFGQLKWEAFHQQRQVAQALSARIDSELSRLLNAEEARSFAEYGFLVVEGDLSSNVLTRSPLSAFPPRPAIPGLVGYFQVDAGGQFSTPLLPANGEADVGYGVGAEERSRRLALQAQIRDVLSDNRLVEGRSPRRPVAAAAPAESSVRDVTSFSDTVREVASGLVSTREASIDEPKADSAGSGMSALREDVSGEKDEAPAVTAATNRADAGGAAADVRARSGKKADEEAQMAPASGGMARREGKAGAPLPAPSPAPVQAQAAFDQLKGKSPTLADKKRKAVSSLGRVEDLELVSPYSKEKSSEPRKAVEQRSRSNVASLNKRSARKEQGLLPEAESPADRGVPSRILTFESELDPFEFSLLDSGHFVLYRKVWRGGQRFIQGVLINQRPFLEGIVGRAFGTSALVTTSKLATAWDGDLLWAVGASSERYTLTSAQDLAGALLHRERLSAPFSDLELVFTVAQLPAGPGARVVAWVAAVIAVVLCGGLALMYRLGARQIDLARQQQDFVSAVSHELRTPLTSIRMYAEMLKEGWAGEEKKRSYYHYIFDESERLSRLIANVLQLARMTRSEYVVDTQPVSVAALMDGIASKVSSQVERAGFALQLTQDPALASVSVQVDEDAFSQIVINLVDNALKFSSGSDIKRVEIHCRVAAGNGVEFTVRDHGPGVPRDQMKKIFRLFYRSQSELTRETVGTGIGLALVSELARAMGARVDVSNVEPGALFTLWAARAAAERGAVH